GKHFSGSVNSLGRRLGLNGVGDLTKSGVQQMLDFINLNSEGDKLQLRKKETAELIPVPETNDQIGDVKQFLAGVFQKIKEEGYNFIVTDLSAYRIESPQFIGTFVSLLRTLGMKKSGDDMFIRSIDLKSLLVAAGIIDE
ncbi:MAG: hypothetical protein Q7T54_04325, partial [Candidatus Levybacteria bacterium]|nr:hypothetical protein [Candidatus Levybacteria bacterium]